MNSDIEILKTRGYIEGDDIREYEEKSKEELILLLDDKVPCVRSKAAKAISYSYDVNEIEITKILLEKLVKEKKLYTRIEIGAALERGGGKSRQKRWCNILEKSVRTSIKVYQTGHQKKSVFLWHETLLPEVWHVWM